MFGISLAIIVPLLSIVVYTTRLAISKVLWRLDNKFSELRWYRRMRWKRRKNNWKRWWAGDTKEGKVESGIMASNGEKRKGGWGISWRGKRELEGANGDTEKGESVHVEANGK